MEAHRSWQLEKYNHIKKVALDQTDELLKNALLKISSKILDDYEMNLETKIFG